MNKLTHLSLFSGIGGLDLAAEWAGITTIGQCEWAKYPAKILEKHWPNVPRWKDIRTLTGDSFYERTGRRTVDIISGGFPCQPFSVAGKRRGKEDDRYLWPEMVRVIKELRPTWIVGENVAGIVRMALPDILSELEACGYRTRTFLIPACAVGARHRRYRVAIVGYSEHNGLSSATASGGVEKTVGREPEGEKKAGESEGKSESGNGKTLAYAKSELSGRLPIGTESEKPRFSSGGKNVSDPDNRSRDVRRDGEFPAIEEAERSGSNIGGRAQEHEPRQWRTAESILGRMADGFPTGMDGDLDFLINHYWDNEPDIPRIATGISHRVDRLKCLGNAVVPQQFYPIFKAIAEVEKP